MDREDLVFRPMRDSATDLELFRSCFAANGSPKSIELIRWQFLEPPPGRVFVELAEVPSSEPRLAAIYATFPAWMEIQGVRRLGVQSIDTLTDERFRGHGLFVRMAETMFHRLAGEDVALVYGFPNGNSAHGFFKRLDWASLDPFPSLLKPLRSRYLINRLPRASHLPMPDFPVARTPAPRLTTGQRFETVTAFDERFNRLWASFAAGVSIAVVRDSPYLAWRLRRPLEAYETVALLEGESLRGYVVIGSKDTDGRTVGKVMELVDDPLDRRIGRALLREGIRRLNERGCGVVWASVFDHSPNAGVFRRSGFFRAPGFLLPSEQHVGARALSLGSTEVALADRRSWYISLLDSDTQ